MTSVSLNNISFLTRIYPVFPSTTRIQGNGNPPLSSFSHQWGNFGVSLGLLTSFPIRYAMGGAMLFSKAFTIKS